MSDWKKIITSGSAAELASLYAPSITGSLFGTASWANNAVTASYIVTAQTASYVNPLNQDVIVTGSVYIQTPAIAGAETLQRWRISDSSTQVQLANATTTPGVFLPALISSQETGSSVIGMAYQSRIGADTGTNAGMLFDVRSGSAATVLTRPLFLWRNYTTEYMLMDATGSLGLGISTPSAKLHVNNTGAGNSFLVEDSANPDSTPFVIDTAGNVGIGTTSPIAKLTISASGVDGILIGTDTSAGNQERSGRLFFGQQDPARLTAIYAISGSMYFSTLASASFSSGTTRMYVSSSGNIGIGTATPTLGTLQVVGNVYATSFTGSLFGTSSWAQNATTASFITTAQTASYVLNAVSSSFASTASFVNPLNQPVIISGSLIVTGSFNALSYPNKLIALTELSNSTLISQSIGTTNFTAINLNSDGTNRYAKTTFTAPLSGQVQIRMEFDMLINNSAAVQMIGLHNTSSATTTPSEGWYRVNADNDSTSGQFYANFTKTSLTPGTTYTYYFMGVCNFSGNLVRASNIQTGSYPAGSDLPSPLRIYVYDLGTTSILSNPST